MQPVSGHNAGHNAGQNADHHAPAAVMGKGRLEAFSDGVIAIIITIMVLELKVPHGDTLADLGPMWPVFVSYVLSFVNVGIYWNNHHHLLHTVHRVSGGILWANLHLLFWLSLMPWATGWMGENHFTVVPVALYGVVLVMAAVAYTLLLRAIVAAQGPQSALAHAVGRDRKGLLSLACYACGVPAALLGWPQVSMALYVLVALIWLVPDRRMERALRGE